MAKWTEKEIIFLKDNYGTNLTAQQCAVSLNRSTSCVFVKASRMGLKSSKNKLKTTKEYTDSISFTVLEEYVNSHIPILHKCSKNHVWKARPYGILNGRGCPECAKLNKTKSHETYVLETSFEVLDKYINSETKIRHKCSEGHIWLVAPNKILAGSGCPECATFSFNPNKPTILYYIKITKNDVDYYKIGITNRTVKKNVLLGRKTLCGNPL